MAANQATLAKKLDFVTVPTISPIQLMSQILDNINTQILCFDLELMNAASESAAASDANTALIQQLWGNVHEILQKTVQTTGLLQDLSGDTSKLKVINGTLQNYADINKKIETLVTALNELEEELVSGEFDYYRVISELLIDAQQQISFFDPYQSIPHVALIRDKLHNVEGELKRQIQWNFRELGQLLAGSEEDSSGNAASPSFAAGMDIVALSQVYLVVDALGPRFRRDLIERFSQLQLIPYEKLFAFGTKFSGLEFLDKRYAWFKRLLSAFNEKVSSLFPVEWSTPYALFEEFRRRTKKHLVESLKEVEKQKLDSNSYVQVVLKALKSILTFEAEMKVEFKMFSTMEDAEDRSKFDYIDSMAEAFDDFLSPYIQLEREGLEALMSKIMSNEDKGIIGEDEGPLKPGDAFPSARKMFEYIRGAFNRCTAYSTGKTYLALSKEFRICLHTYAESLKFRCPSPEYTKPGKPLVYNVTPEIEPVLCRIVVTGNYCIDTIPSLEQLMKKNILPDLADKIDFSGQIDMFNDMVAFTLGIMIQGISQRVLPAFKKMRDMNWGLVSNVGDESLYVKEAIAVLNSSIPRIRLSIPSSYFQSFCMKLVTAILDLLLENIWKLKRITQEGAGQLLLDLNGFKEYLLRMPNAKLEAGKEPIVISNAYKTFVNSRNQHIQIILKLVCTDDDKMTEMFAILWPEGTPDDLESIKALKGKASLADPVVDKLKEGGDKLKEGVEKIGTTVIGAKAMTDVKSGLGDAKKTAKTGFGGLKSAFSDIKAAFSGDLFDDHHSNPNSHHGNNSYHGNSNHGNNNNPNNNADPKKAVNSNGNNSNRPTQTAPPAQVTAPTSNNPGSAIKPVGNKPK